VAVDPVTHVAAGVLISQLVPMPSRFWGAVAGVAFGLLPDIDYFLIFWDRLAFIRHHRGFTHSLVAIPLLALLGAAVNAVIGGKDWFRPFFILGLLVLASHLLLDLATSYGTQILSPFTRRKFTLDWLFIIDPYLTGILLIGAFAALISPTWGRKAGAVCLAGAAAYFLICGLYQRQALTMAHEVFKRQNPGENIAALPQPFSCRRWQLLTAGPQVVRQTFVELPWASLAAVSPNVKFDEDQVVSPAGCRVPSGGYPPPWNLRVQLWSRAAASPPYSPEARRVLDSYLEFARFPLLHCVRPLEGGQLQEWLDLRFSVPGREFPFVLQLRLDPQGRLEDWVIGRCLGRVSSEQ
jgi:inner membrane protein